MVPFETAVTQPICAPIGLRANTLAPWTPYFLAVFSFLGASEAVEVGSYAYILKSQVGQERHKLCLRQGAGDSTSPQIDVAAHVIAEFGIEHYICKLQPAAGA
jgi:hypothetical protein